jgi:hypothetical protein
MANGTVFSQLRQLPPEAVDANNLIGVRHRGKLATLTASARIQAFTFQTGDLVGLRNTTAAPVSISAEAGLTVKLENSGAVGTRTLAAYGQASLWFESPTVVWITGGGVS